MDITEQLIEIVRGNPCLYDVQVTGYLSRREREKVWRGIAEHFNLSVGHCKSRWKGLRDCYKRCHRWKQQGKSNATQWKFFGLMSFLDDIETYKRTPTKNSIKKYDTEFLAINDGTKHSPEVTEETVSSFPTAAVNKPNIYKIDCEDSLSHLDEPPTDSSCSSPDIAVNSRIDANDPIELYFLSLARQIKDVGLPKEMIIDIESKMSAYIFDTIGEFLKNKDKPTRS